MARPKTTSALLVTFLSQVFAQQYQLIQEYNASNIFEEFSFFTGTDPTGGFVQYVSKEVAASTPLIGNSSNLIYIGADSASSYSPGGAGRASVRLESKLTFTEGLFVFDLTHIPVGCGTWPAIWTAGLSDWPADGEIDIIENVNDARVNNAAIHATGECLVNATTAQTGIWKNTDCNINHDENQGCGTSFTEPFNYGPEFNANGGGVYAMEWTSGSIKIWFFPPRHIPATLSAGRVPNPATFGLPSAVFSGPCSGSFSEKFFNHSIIIGTTFCGGWAGGSFGTGSSSCPSKLGSSPQDSCVDFVANNPSAFKETYWGIRNIRVWERVPGFTVPGLAAPGTALPLPVTTIEPLDVLIKGGTSKTALVPVPTIGSLSISPLTGGVLNVGNDLGDEDTYDDVGDDLEDVLDDSLNADDTDTFSDIFDDILDDTQTPSGIVIAVNADPIVSNPTVPLDTNAAFYDGGNLFVLPPSPTTHSVRAPFGFSNTEGRPEIFAPEIPIPAATNGPSALGLNGNTGVVPLHLQQGPPVRQQSSAPGVPIGVQIPHTLPLLLPNPIENVVQSGLGAPLADTPDVTALQVVTPGLGPFPTALKHSNPLIPAGIGSTGSGSPSTSTSPIAILWSKLGSELKNQLMVAATNLSLLLPGSDPLDSLWDSLSPALRNEILSAASNPPALAPETSVPTIHDLINTVQAVKTPYNPYNPYASPLQEPSLLDVPPPIKPAGGLLGFLDAKTKNKLKILLGQASAASSDGDDVKRQVPVGNPLKGVAAAGSPQPLSNLGEDGVTAIPPPSAAPVLLNHSTSPPGVLKGNAPNNPPQPVPLPVALPAPFPNVFGNAVLGTPSQLATNNLSPLSSPHGVGPPIALLPPRPSNEQSISNPGNLLSALFQPAAPVFKLTPVTPVTALTSTDTTKAMTGLLSFLDDNAKSQIADMLFADDSTTGDNSEPGTEATTITRRQATSTWTPQDKLALAQNLYALCPVPILNGIPFPSTNDFVTDLLTPSKTLEEAAAAFQRKLQAYFDVAVQGCWGKINEWLAWRQLLRKPGASILPAFPPTKSPKSRIRKRQIEDDTEDDTAEGSDPKGLIEQKIYAICPKPETFSTDQLILDLEDADTSIEVAIGKFQNKLWAYMAKLQECSDKIRSLGPQLKSLADTTSEPMFHIVDTPSADTPSIKASSTESIAQVSDAAAIEPIFHIVDFPLANPLLTEVPPTEPDLQASDAPWVKTIFDSAGSSKMRRHHARDISPGVADVPPEQIIGFLTQLQENGVVQDPRAQEQLQSLVLDLAQATATQSSVEAPATGSAESQIAIGPGTTDEVFTGTLWVPRNGTNVTTAATGAGLPSDISLPVDEGGSDSGLDDGIDVPPETGNVDPGSVAGDLNAIGGTPPAVEDSNQGSAPPSDGAIDPNVLLPLEASAPLILGRQELDSDQNGVILDAQAPADLDAILGPAGTLDPYGYLEPQNASPDSQEQPDAADSGFYDLPDTAVDEASPDVDQALTAGPQDPFGQLQYNKDAGTEDAQESWESSQFLGMLRNYEHSEESGKYLGDPDDVDNFVSKYLGGGTPQ